MATPNTVSDQGVGPLPKHVSVVAVLFFSDTFHDIVLASLAFPLAQGSPELTALLPQPVEGWDQECVLLPPGGTCRHSSVRPGYKCSAAQRLSFQDRCLRNAREHPQDALENKNLNQMTS